MMVMNLISEELFSESSLWRYWWIVYYNYVKM